MRDKFQVDLYGKTLTNFLKEVICTGEGGWTGWVHRHLALYGYQEMEILVCWPFFGTETYFYLIQTASSLEAALWFWNMVTNVGLLWMTMPVLTDLF